MAFITNRLNRALVAAMLATAVPCGAFAQEAASTPESAAPAQAGLPLWQTLNQGDSPEEAARKVAAMDGIKSAVVKGSGDKVKVVIKYQADDSIPIDREPYQIGLQFANGKLVKVLLVDKSTCANNIVEHYSNIVTSLSEKYPKTLIEPTKLDDIRLAVLNSDDKSADLVTVMSDDKTAVVFSQKFYAIKRPGAPRYQFNQVAQLLATILWQQYDNAVAACGGTGENRVQKAITYLPVSDYTAMKDKIETEIEAEKTATTNKL